MKEFIELHKFEHIEKKSRELQIRNEALDLQSLELLNELKVTSKQLTQFIENRSNFSETNWSTLMEQRIRLEEMLQKDLENVRDPLKTKKTLAERHVGNHWMFVR